jgi:hypothetical protein
MKRSRLIIVSALMVLLTLVFVYVRLTKPKTEATQTEKVASPKPDVSLPPTNTPQLPVVPPAVLAPAPLKKGNRSFYGTLPPALKDINDLRLVNKVSDQWQKKLEVNLRRIGGEKLKTLKVSPQESYIISDGDEGRMVERVIVKLESKDGEYTSFFAEVDSESGHVIKTWGVAIPEKARHRH